MIFGFNTDVAVAGTVYHVQTEMREHAALLESQIFIQGRCVGRRGSQPPAGISEEELHELARSQHRQVVEAIRGGRMLGLVLPRQETAKKEPDAPLAIEFLSSQRPSESDLRLCFRVLRGSSAARGAEVLAVWKSLATTLEGAPEASGKGEASTDADGMVELRLDLGDNSAELELKARLDGQETSRRFLLKSSKG
jgi:hypothetical protein